MYFSVIVKYYGCFNEIIYGQCTHIQKVQARQLRICLSFKPAQNLPCEM